MVYWYQAQYDTTVLCINSIRSTTPTYVFVEIGTVLSFGIAAQDTVLSDAVLYPGI